SDRQLLAIVMVDGNRNDRGGAVRHHGSFAAAWRKHNSGQRAARVGDDLSPSRPAHLPLTDPSHVDLGRPHLTGQPVSNSGAMGCFSPLHWPGFMPLGPVVLPPLPTCRS